MRLMTFTYICLHFLVAHVAEARVANPKMRSESVLVQFADTHDVVFSKKDDIPRPIASITKLLSGIVLKNLSEVYRDTNTKVVITEDDKDKMKWSRSRLRVGLELTPIQLLHAALGASDNRAMHAVVRAAQVTRGEFVKLMNETAYQIGMVNSHFADPAGLDPSNVSTARDLTHLLEVVSQSDDLRQHTLSPKVELEPQHHRPIVLNNPNRLTRSERWDIVVGKTGYTKEAGRTLVLRAKIKDRPVDMIFLGAHEKASVFGDASRIKDWLQSSRRISMR